MTRCSTFRNLAQYLLCIKSTEFSNADLFLAFSKPLGNHKAEKKKNGQCLPPMHQQFATNDPEKKKSVVEKTKPVLSFSRYLQLGLEKRDVYWTEYCTVTAHTISALLSDTGRMYSHRTQIKYRCREINQE